MPLFPPGWPTKLAMRLSRVLALIASSPHLRALLEGRSVDRGRYAGWEDLSPDQEETLRLMLYWFWEYVGKSISPLDLLTTLQHLATSKFTED